MIRGSQGALARISAFIWAPISPLLVGNKDHSWNAAEAVKRVFDVLVAVAALILLSPLLALIAIAIKLESEGPVIFRQERAGRNFQRFEILKFRTMVVDAPAKGPLFTSDGDPRVTYIGSMLRRWKLDELPQLVNIVRGDMSLVGPRPLVTKYVELFRDDYREILSVRPGLTDPSSIEYIAESELLGNAADPEHEYVTAILPHKLRLARQYLKERSLGGDLRVLAKTAWALLVLRVLGRVEFLRLVTIAVDASLIALAYCAAFALRFDGHIPHAKVALLGGTLPWFVSIQMVVYLEFLLHKTIWRYVGLGDVLRIIGATSTGMIFFLGLVLSFEPSGFPRSIFMLAALVQVSMLSGARVLRRIIYDLRRPDCGKRILIFGAGDAGEMIVRDMKHNPYYGYNPVGFIDDNPAKLGGRIHGIPVLGGRRDFESVIRQVAAEEVLIAMPRVPATTIRDIVKSLEPHGVRIRMLPSLRDVIDGGATGTMSAPPKF